MEEVSLKPRTESYIYLYKLKDGEIDKKIGLQRITSFSWNNLSDDVDKTQFKEANWFQRLMYWKDLEEYLEVKYYECSKDSPQGSYSQFEIIKKKVNMFYKTERFASKVHFELLLKKQDPEKRYYEFKGYKWSELKDIHLHKRIGYMYHFDSEKKSSFMLDIVKILIGAAVGAAITYYIKNSL